MSDLMHAVCIHRFGGPEVLSIEQVPIPTPAEGEVLVCIFAAGVNPLDYLTRQGAVEKIFPHQLPLILGWDASGVVTKNGPGVDRFKPGDAIFGRGDFTRDGAYADFAVLPATQVVHKPRSIDYVEAAAIPIAAATAWQALSMGAQGSRMDGQAVLIHGAAGGVGHFAVQIAKALGALVIGTGSAASGEFVQKLGADVFVDYRSPHALRTIDKVDFVLDTVGAQTQQLSSSLLKPNGMLVSCVSPPSTACGANFGVRTGMVNVASTGADQLNEILNLIMVGKVQPHVSQTMPLSEVRSLHTVSETGHARGKLVLVNDVWKSPNRTQQWT
jgi:NADPH:quinone reductase-like Zn-dependent oxidoreductase